MQTTITTTHDGKALDLHSKEERSLTISARCALLDGKKIASYFDDNTDRWVQLKTKRYIPAFRKKLEDGATTVLVAAQ
jgi:hypothetical protein